MRTVTRPLTGLGSPVPSLQPATNPQNPPFFGASSVEYGQAGCYDGGKIEVSAMGQRRTISGSRMLITGASQGIGKALAERAAARGAKVLVCARKVELLE